MDQPDPNATRGVRPTHIAGLTYQKTLGMTRPYWFQCMFANARKPFGYVCMLSFAAFP